jgi:hypothetical protein
MATTDIVKNPCPTGIHPYLQPCTVRLPPFRHLRHLPSCRCTTGGTRCPNWPSQTRPTWRRCLPRDREPARCRGIRQRPAEKRSRDSALLIRASPTGPFLKRKSGHWRIINALKCYLHYILWYFKMYNYPSSLRLTNNQTFSPISATNAPIPDLLVQDMNSFILLPVER